MGGTTVLGFTAAYPDRVNALIMSDTTGGYSDPDIVELRKKLPQNPRTAFAPDFPKRDPARAFLYREISAITDAYNGPAPAAPATQPPPAPPTDIRPILATHCAACHSEHATNIAFTAPPLGVELDSYDHVRALSPRIQKVAVDSEIMPLGNTTGMTRAERQKLGAWIAAGTPR